MVYFLFQRSMEKETTVTVIGSAPYYAAGSTVGAKKVRED